MKQSLSFPSDQFRSRLAAQRDTLNGESTLISRLKCPITDGPLYSTPYRSRVSILELDRVFFDDF